eukprot:CAMPEP_0118925064 /NCGR_PEP_ID=MMETSP1169-20130426/2992_1 /TAXON_ID=36882 /ORGANISM="Pyramimonas obovata, Strain CCMP722" /LENGTH=201 /DNA_ID=CAMNT_0006866261 /DNA_START=390 /DNA_END=996 /DNA_ORIENTATION=-
MLLAGDYIELLTNVAKAGVVVLAPQLYSPLALVTTSVQKEQERAMESQRWAAVKLQDYLPKGVRADLSHGVIVAGHSRGGLIALLTAQERSPDEDPPVRGVIFLDPVDTKSEPRYFYTRKPALVFGTDDEKCAPKGLNHVKFFQQCHADSAWHVVAHKVAHMDLLNSQLGWLSSICASVCKTGVNSREYVRDFLAGCLSRS